MPTVTFKYHGFWDVPRILLFQYKKRMFLLSSFFDPEADTYEKTYSIRLLPASVGQRLDVSFEMIELWLGFEPVGQVAVKDVIFDPSKRQTLDASFVDKYLTEK